MQNMLQTIHFRILCGVMAALLAWEPAAWAAGQVSITINEAYGQKTGQTDFTIIANTQSTAFSFLGPKPTYNITEGGWIEGYPGCIQIAAKINDGSVPGTVKCIKPANAGTCVPGSGGGQVCTSDLQPSPITGIPSTCNDVLVQTAFKDPSSCTQYQKDCIQKSKSCVKKDAAGTCQSWDVTYDCGKNVTFTPPPQTGTGGSTCPSAYDCSDGSCIQQTPEINTGFGQAASALQAAQTMQSDGSCDPVTGVCTVFPGKSLFCKNYEFIGQVKNNCCAAPIPNPDMGNYIKLILTMNTVDNAMMMLSKGGASSGIVGAWAGVHGAVSSSWTSLGNTASGAFDTITKPLVTQFDTLVGNTSTMLSTAAKKVGVNLFQSAAKKGATTAVKTAVQKGATQGIIGGMENALMRKAAEWTAKAFSRGVANTLFVKATVTGAPSATGAVGANGVVAQNVVLSQTASTVLGGVMIAYAVYQIAVILVAIIFKCTNDQFTFLSDIKLKTCHVVGTGCGSSVCLVPSLFGGCVLSKCVRWDTKGCCFNSPLSRIIQEQARPQLGKSWIASSGTDSNGYYYFNTSCGGITTNELQNLDWSKIDLSEWVAILQTTGNWPQNGTISVNSITGAGSKFDVGAQSTDIGTRLNAKQRVEDRIGNQNLNKLRQSVGKGLWNQIP